MILKIQFSTSYAFASQVIRRLSHSPFSHCDLVTDTGLLGVSGPDKSLNDPGGVLIRSFTPWPYRTVRTVTLETDKAAQVIEIAKTQIGKPFDDAALYSFLADGPGDRDWRAVEQWFCSELVTWSLEQAGFFPYSLLVCKNRVSPADLLLLLNPFLSETDIREIAP